jgi:hypothetical protein
VLKEPGFWADCVDSQNEPCKNIVSRECAFVTATKIRQKKFDHIVNDVSTVIGVLSLPFSASAMVTARGLQFAKHGLFVANDIASIIIAADQEQFVENCEIIFGEGVGQSYASNIILFSAFLGGVQVVDAIGTALIPYKTKTLPNWSTVKVLRDVDLDEAINYIADVRIANEYLSHTGIQLMDSKYKASILSVEEKLKKIHGVVEIEGLIATKLVTKNSYFHARPGVNIFSSEYDNLRKLINKYRAKYGNTPPAVQNRISEIINEISDVKLNSLINQLSDDLVEFLSGGATEVVNHARFKIWSFADDIEIDYNINQLEVISGRVLPPANSGTIPLTIDELDELAYSLLLIEEQLGNGLDKKVIFELLGNQQFINHFDLVPAIKIFDNIDITLPSLNDSYRNLMNEYENAHYWLSRGKTNVYANKEFGGDAINEIDTRFGEAGIGTGGIVECKRIKSSASASNWKLNAFNRMYDIKNKWIVPTKLSEAMKAAFPKKYGQLRIDVSIPGWDSFDTPSDFVNYIKNHEPNIIGPSTEHIGTLEQLSSFEEYHIIIKNKRIIIKGDDWN